MDLNTVWNADAAKVLTFYKRIFSILGIWVFDEGKIFSMIRWFTITTLELSTTVTATLEVIRHCKGYEDAINAFFIICSSLTSLNKLLLHRVNWRYKLILVKSIIQDWSAVKNPYSREIMLKYARRGRLGSLVFFYLVCFSIVPYIFNFALANLPWTSEQKISNETYERKLVIEMTYCVFGKYTFLLPAYICISTLQILWYVLNAISISGNDGFFLDLTMHLCGQFEILQVDFANMTDKKDFCRSKLAALLKRHYQLICLADYLEKAFNPVVFSTLFISVLIVCTEGFQLLLSLNAHDTDATIAHIINIVAILVQPFLYCFAGQTLESQSQELAYAIYKSSWYNCDVSMMKNLLLIILRTAHPHQLTAGKFVVINYMSFKELLKASLSYLSVLRVMLDA